MHHHHDVMCTLIASAPPKTEPAAKHSLEFALRAACCVLLHNFAHVLCAFRVCMQTQPASQRTSCPLLYIKRVFGCSCGGCMEYIKHSSRAQRTCNAISSSTTTEPTDRPHVLLCVDSCSRITTQRAPPPPSVIICADASTAPALRARWLAAAYYCYDYCYYS